MDQQSYYASISKHNNYVPPLNYSLPYNTFPSSGSYHHNTHGQQQQQGENILCFCHLENGKII